MGHWIRQNDRVLGLDPDASAARQRLITLNQPAGSNHRNTAAVASWFPALLHGDRWSVAVVFDVLANNGLVDVNDLLWHLPESEAFHRLYDRPVLCFLPHELLEELVGPYVYGGLFFSQLESCFSGIKLVEDVI